MNTQSMTVNGITFNVVDNVDATYAAPENGQLEHVSVTCPRGSYSVINLGMRDGERSIMFVFTAGLPSIGHRGLQTSFQRYTGSAKELQSWIDAAELLLAY